MSTHEQFSTVLSCIYNYNNFNLWSMYKLQLNYTDYGVFVKSVFVMLLYMYRGMCILCRISLNMHVHR